MRIGRDSLRRSVSWGVVSNETAPTADVRVQGGENGLTVDGIVDGERLQITEGDDGTLTVRVGDNRPLGEDEQRLLGDVAVHHGHRRVAVSDGEGRHATFDTRGEFPAVGVQTRQDDGSYDRYYRTVGEKPHRLRMTDDGVTFGLVRSLVDRSERRLDGDERDPNRGRDPERDH